jgi:hypothetical protein
MSCPKFSESSSSPVMYNCSKGGISNLRREDYQNVFDSMSHICKSSDLWQRCPVYTDSPAVERCRVESWHDCDIGSPSRSPGGCDGAWCAPWARYVHRIRGGSSYD